MKNKKVIEKRARTSLFICCDDLLLVSNQNQQTLHKESKQMTEDFLFVGTTNIIINFTPSNNKYSATAPLERKSGRAAVIFFSPRHNTN